MKTNGFGLSEGRIWQFLTVKLFKGSTRSTSVVGSFLNPMNWPLSFNMKYRGRQFRICSPESCK